MVRVVTERVLEFPPPTGASSTTMLSSMESFVWLPSSRVALSSPLPAQWAVLFLLLIKHPTPVDVVAATN
jgi:hypothetical protein